MSQENAGANSQATQPLVQPPQQQPSTGNNANANPPPNATFTIQPPEAFDFAKPQQ